MNFPSILSHTTSRMLNYVCIASSWHELQTKSWDGIRVVSRVELEPEVGWGSPVRAGGIVGGHKNARKGEKICLDFVKGWDFASDTGNIWAPGHRRWGQDIGTDNPKPQPNVIGSLVVWAQPKVGSPPLHTQFSSYPSKLRIALWAHQESTTMIQIVHFIKSRKEYADKLYFVNKMDGKSVLDLNCPFTGTKCNLFMLLSTCA